ncbi:MULTISPECIES: phytanoyl-CoA dioxygenase family protein [Streptomyces]|uniref:Phytanoyl-CoA dioxygenase n=1 Tax=Streptomyces parvulus TaxID=146923 RepID=A0A191V6M7_9ACTN|nr:MULTISPECIES: phytanoyl-CoA dioxygenase family protein [Streptomyces]ANJ10575.1 phytanoyl-CoA dioxygenase [Streptomyces parvulus]MZD56287.1 phytanoyl-CoA dioxygenase [Streptomyces sp. SID5606]GGR98110.1 phytanoyl-CoA dioxygenase [Streptomyces parvulus]
MSATPVPAPGARFSARDCDLDALRALVERPADPADHPRADAVEQGVPVYEAGRLRDDAGWAAELVHALADGPGIVVLRGAFPDPAVVDRATAVFDALIDAQRASGAAAGDHFAAPGANDRVWNALEKAALHDPETFAEYYANDALALVSRAWLGPGYQVTSQINVVNPGGAAQSPHRDYHLGFLSDEAAAAYPAHVHRLSPVLTLQGAVAHRDMPVESGPTMYLPYSQKYAPGYLAWRRPEFRAYFEARHVQLPLAKGDAVFFSPALFHAAGANRSADVRRMANLLQISSAFGRAMESVDREAVVNAVYPVLLERRAGGADERWLENVVAASAEGYPFPTDLDRDPPVGGLAPPSQADLVRRALGEGRPPEVLRGELRAAGARRGH